MEPANPWISVEDRLPEPGTDLHAKNLEVTGDPTHPTFSLGAYVQDGDRAKFTTNGKWEVSGITHWRYRAIVSGE